MAPMARFLSQVIARWHRALGRLARRMGRPAAARAHFERALALGADPFADRVELAALAFAAGDYGQWRRLLEEARAAAPERFARLVDPALGAAPRLAGTAAAHAGFGPRDDDAAPACAPSPDDGFDAVAPCGDDCGSPRERARLRGLGPIRRDEIVRCDLDELAKRLSG
jgi:hypothetical protein